MNSSGNVPASSVDVKQVSDANLTSVLHFTSQEPVAPSACAKAFRDLVKVQIDSRVSSLEKAL